MLDMTDTFFLYQFILKRTVLEESFNIVLQPACGRSVVPATILHCWCSLQGRQVYVNVSLVSTEDARFLVFLDL